MVDFRHDRRLGLVVGGSRSSRGGGVKREHAASVFVGLSCTGFFLWLALRQVHLAELRMAFFAARWEWLFPMAAIVLLDILVRAVRWRILLSRARPAAPILELMRLETIGLGINNVLFLRLGEVARGLLAARRLGFPSFAALASVAIERALDVAALLTIFVAAASLRPGFVPKPVRAGALILLAVAVAALVTLALAEGVLAQGGFAERMLRPWPKIHSLAEQLALGAAVLREPTSALQAAALSLLLWSVDAIYYWAGARALGLGAFMDYPRSVLTLSWAGASSALPAAPGAIGTFEAIVGDILVRFGAAPGQALAYALVCHLLTYLLVTGAALLLLYRVGLSLAQLRGQAEER